MEVDIITDNPLTDLDHMVTAPRHSQPILDHVDLGEAPLLTCDVEDRHPLDPGVEVATE